jgi:hypothetical protein
VALFFLLLALRERAINGEKYIITYGPQQIYETIYAETII